MITSEIFGIDAGEQIALSLFWRNCETCIWPFCARAAGALGSIVSNAILANYPAWASTFWNRELLNVQYIRGGALEDSGRAIVRPLSDYLHYHIV